MAATMSNPEVTSSWNAITAGETGEAVVQNKNSFPILVTMHTTTPGASVDGIELLLGDVFNRGAEATGHIYVKNQFNSNASGATVHLIEDVSS